MKTNSLRGKTAWVTGGKRIGQSIIRALAKEGANIVVSYRSSEKEAREAVKGIKDALIVSCDTSNPESVKESVSAIRKKFKKLDLLVLMASVFHPVKLEKISDRDWESNFSVHVKGTFWPIQHSLPLMPKGSHIITISDRTAVGRIYPGYLPYVVTKSAVAAMTKALAVELGSKGIIINSIAPGPILRPPDISVSEWKRIRSESIIKYPISDREAVEEFVQTVIRLAKIRSSGCVYPLDLGHQ
jgi:NAD(P)-dependent dehydrogenase (short-subunit alcohol dehydrogenase family)